MNEAENNKIIFAIPYIRFSGLARQEKWLIIETVDRVYFIQNDSFVSIFPQNVNPLRELGFAIIRRSDEMYLEKKIDWSAQNLGTILSESLQYVSILKRYINEVVIKNSFLGGATLFLPRDIEAREKTRTIRLKLKARQIKAFLQIVQRCLDTPITSGVPIISIVNSQNKLSVGGKVFEIVFQIALFVFLVGFFLVMFLRPEWLERWM